MSRIVQHIDATTGEVLDGPLRQAKAKYHRADRPRHNEPELYRLRFDRLYGQSRERLEYRRSQRHVRRHQTRYKPRHHQSRPLVHLVGHLALYGVVMTLFYIAK